MANKKIEQGLVSLNSKLSDELYIKELEQRLETDPLAVGGLIDFGHGDPMYSGCLGVHETGGCTGEYSSCIGIHW